MKFKITILAALIQGCGSGGGGGAQQVPVQTPEATPAANIRQAVACPQQTPATMVMLAFGQSNSSNWLEKKFSSNRVINFFDGHCYMAQDPLLGADGEHGSMWTLLGDKLLTTGAYDAVVVIAAGHGGTRIAQWEQNPWLDDALVTPYTITHFLWHQGESDAYKTPQADYAAALTRIIAKAHSRFPNAPFFVSIASRIGLNAPDPVIQAAQRSVIGPGVFQGPDTDVYDNTYRWSNSHFNAVAQELITDQWVALLRP